MFTLFLGSFILTPFLSSHMSFISLSITNPFFIALCHYPLLLAWQTSPECNQSSPECLLVGQRRRSLFLGSNMFPLHPFYTLHVSTLLRSPPSVLIIALLEMPSHHRAALENQLEVVLIRIRSKPVVFWSPPTNKSTITCPKEFWWYCPLSGI